jgi:hypothetical protein
VPGLLLRDTGDLADKHLAVEVEERFKHFPLRPGGDQLVGGKRRGRPRSRHGVSRPADRHARMDRRDSADRIEPALANEPTEQTQANEATEPIDRIDPAEPMLRIEPEEPIDRIDPLDPMLRIEPAEPPDRCDLPLIPMPGFSHPGMGTAAWAWPYWGRR